MGLPYLTWLTIGMISFVLVYMLFDKSGREQVLLSLLVAAIVIVIAVVKEKVLAGRATAYSGVNEDVTAS